MRPMTKLCTTAAIAMVAFSASAPAMASGEDGYDGRAQTNNVQQGNVPSLGEGISGLFKALDTGTTKTGAVIGSGFGFIAKLASKIPSSGSGTYYMQTSDMKNSAGNQPTPDTKLLGRAQNNGMVEISGASNQEVMFGITRLLNDAHDIKTGVSSADAKTLSEGSIRIAKVSVKYDASNVNESLKALTNVLNNAGMSFALERDAAGKVIYVFAANKPLIAAMNKDERLVGLTKAGAGVSEGDINAFLQTYKPEGQNFAPSGVINANVDNAQERLKASVRNMVNEKTQRAFR